MSWIKKAISMKGLKAGLQFYYSGDPSGLLAIGAPVPGGTGADYVAAGTPPRYAATGSAAADPTVWMIAIIGLAWMAMSRGTFKLGG